MEEYLVIKIGGRPASDAGVLKRLVSDIGRLAGRSSNGSSPFAGGIRPVLVHGGGAEVSEMSRRLGIEPKFVAGKRQTSPEEMRIVEAVLAGNVNTRLLRAFLAEGIPAVGLSGVDSGLFTGEAVDAESRTGRITATRPGVLRHLSSGGFVPVVSSVSSTEDGTGGLNINADDAAMALAVALEARCLIYISDIPGILAGDRVLESLDPENARAHIKSGVISGGMIPKVESSLGALEQRVGRVVIGPYESAGDLDRLVHARLGTSLIAAE